MCLIWKRRLAENHSQSSSGVADNSCLGESAEVYGPDFIWISELFEGPDIPLRMVLRKVVTAFSMFGSSMD